MQVGTYRQEKLHTEFKNKHMSYLSNKERILSNKRVVFY